MLNEASPITGHEPDDAARRARVAMDRAMIRRVAHYCGPAMQELAALTQDFVSWMWSPGSNGIGSARDQDNAELDRAKRRSRYKHAEIFIRARFSCISLPVASS